MAELWLFYHWEVALLLWEPQGTKGDPRVFIFTKNISNWSRNGWAITIFPLRGCVIPMKTPWDQRGSLGIHLCQKDPKSVKKWLSYTNFPLRGCVISLRTTWDQRGSLGVLLCQKDLKLVKKRLSYGYLPTERLCDINEKHMGPKGILGCSFVPKRFKVGLEISELLLFSHWEVAWFHWEPQGTKGDP